MAKDKEPKAAVEIKTLAQLKNHLNKSIGPGTIVIGRKSIEDVDSVPTGIATLDKALGCCGVPVGRIIELFGTESGGKTTLSLNIIAAFQQTHIQSKKRRGVAAFIDVEHAFDPQWAANNGVDIDHLLFSQPDSGEDAFTIMENLCDSGLVDIVVVDSTAALITKAELDGEIEDHHIGAQARLMSRGLRKIAGKCSKAGMTIIFINQIREKIGVMFGSPETTPGGRALKFYSSIRMDVRRVGPIKDGETIVGSRTKIKVVKNKVAPPFVEAELNLMYGTPFYGVDRAESLIMAGIATQVLKRSSNRIVYGEQYVGPGGVEKAATFLRADKEYYDRIYADVYAKLAVPVAPEPAETDPEIDPTADPILDARSESDGCTVV